MSPEILNLLYFYRSDIGQVAFKIILSALQTLWDTPPKHLAGIGYCDPFLDAYHGSHTDCLSLIPRFTGLYARTGIGTYPTALIQETSLPLKPDKHDHILCIHIIEHTAHPEIFLKELFNCLAPEGEVIFIVVNRHGAWARNDCTPFGSGRPYSKKQLIHILQQVGFIINDYQPVLFIKPTASFTSHYYSKTIETIGKLLLPRYGGLHIIRAIKRIYVPPMKDYKSELLDFIPNLPVLIPESKPIRERY